jgi:hypothetical protein
LVEAALDRVDLELKRVLVAGAGALENLTEFTQNDPAFSVRRLKCCLERSRKRQRPSAPTQEATAPADVIPELPSFQNAGAPPTVGYTNAWKQPGVRGAGQAVTIMANLMDKLPPMGARAALLPMQPPAPLSQQPVLRQGDMSEIEALTCAHRATPAGDTGRAPLAELGTCPQIPQGGAAHAARLPDLRAPAAVLACSAASGLCSAVLTASPRPAAQVYHHLQLGAADLCEIQALTQSRQVSHALTMSRRASSGPDIRTHTQQPIALQAAGAAALYVPKTMPTAAPGGVAAAAQLDPAAFSDIAAYCAALLTASMQ